MSFSHDAEFRMLHKLAETSGSSISAMASRCVSEYLRDNYSELMAFYSQAPTTHD